MSYQTTQTDGSGYDVGSVRRSWILMLKVKTRNGYKAAE